MEKGEWKEVRSRNHRSVFDRMGSKNQVFHNAINIYVSNFPSHLSKRELWNICGIVGKLLDVYIARNKNKLGQMFAFCRFENGQNSETLVEELMKIWIGKLKLHANVARFGKDQASKVGSLDMNKLKKTDHASKNSEVLRETSRWVPTGTTSYASVVKDGVKDEEKGYMNIHQIHNVEEKSIQGSQAKSSHLKFAVLGEFKAFASIENAKVISKIDEFGEVDTLYLGGMWVLFQFTNKDYSKKFMDHKGISSWFKNMSPWCDDFVVNERLIWLEIEGVPLLAWHPDTFKDIGKRWGETVFLDDSENYNRLGKRMCVKSTCQSLIFQTNSVMFKGITYYVRVRELCSWTPTFTEAVNDVEESSSNGGDECSHIHENGHDGDHEKDEHNEGGSITTNGHGVEVHWVESDLVDHIEEGKNGGDSALDNDRCVKICTVSNKVEGEILGDNFESAPAKDPKIVSPSTPPRNDLNLAGESDFTRLDYVGPLIGGEIDSEKRWSYRDPKGNVHGLFSLAQLRLWKDYLPSDLPIWSYVDNVKETILLHKALTRQSKDAG